MKQLCEMSMEELLRPQGHACACGRVHRTNLAFLRVGAGALAALPEALQASGRHRPFVVMDENTYAAAGKRALAVLREREIPFSAYTFAHRDAALEPDERAVGALTMAFDPSCDSVLAVGSGVINDCAKVLAHTAGVPSLVAATAPSMDGYASDSASMIQNRVKVSLYNACPVAILADTDVLRLAPERMLHAGLGDMIAKYISLFEWRVSHWVTGEYYCEEIAALVRSSLRRVMDNAEGLMRREEKAVAAVVEGLVLSGVAMSFAQISRPASGLEHYFSHLWEMFALEGRVPPSLHGEQCGVGACLTLRLLDTLLTKTPSRAVAERAMADFSQQAWEKEIHRIFGATADEVLALEARVHKNDPAAHAERLERILTHWPEIQQAARDELPNAQTLRQRMDALGLPTRPDQLGLCPQDTLDAYFGSREIRDKYLTSTLLWDLGLLAPYAALLTQGNSAPLR